MSTTREPKSIAYNRVVLRLPGRKMHDQGKPANAALPYLLFFSVHSIIHFYILSYCISLLLGARIFPPLLPTFLFPRIQIYMYTEMFSSELLMLDYFQLHPLMCARSF